MRPLARSLALLTVALSALGMTLPAQQPQPPAGGQQPSVPGNPQPGGYPQYQGGYFGGYQKPPQGYQKQPYGYRQYNPYLPPAPVATTEVAIHDHYFDPPSIQVAPGATVRWTNKGQRPHRVAELTGKWKSPDLAPGDSWSLTLRKPLNQHYYCPHHRLTMNATIIVK
jgi:hypothetical protein